MSGFRRIGGDVRIPLRSWNMCSHSSPHENFADFLRNWMMGRVLSANLGRNHDMAVRHPTKCCTSLTLVGLRHFDYSFAFLRVCLDSLLGEHKA